MIVTPDDLLLIMQNRKTMLRIPAPPGQRECRYKRDRLYVVQSGRGKAVKAHITVTDVTKEPLRAITLRDVRREGFRTSEQFFEYWDSRNLSPHCDVWVVSFVKGDIRDMDRYLASGSPSQFCQSVKGGKRCGRAFAENQTVCACGAKRPDETMDDHGYTTDHRRGLRGEPPAIPADLQDRYSRKAREKDAERRLSPVHGRVAAIEAELEGLRVELREHPFDRALHRDLTRLERALETVKNRRERAA